MNPAESAGRNKSDGASESRISNDELAMVRSAVAASALEEGGSRLNCGFDFPEQPGDQIICRVYSATMIRTQ